MYVHIGGDRSISDHFIIGIFDLDIVTADPGTSQTMDYLRQMEDLGRLDVLTEDIPRTLIATVDRAYLSPVSAATLKTRIERGPAAWLSGGQLEDQE